MTDVERGTEIFAIVQFLVIGVSHVLQPRAWVRFFDLLREKGHAGVFFVAFLSLGFGSIVVALHNVWSGIPAVLTMIGWAQVTKGAIYFAFPDFGLRRLQFVTHERTRMFVIPGLGFIAVAGLLAYHLLATRPPG